MQKNLWKVTMVSPNQIASKHYRCCTTTKAVQNFCTRYGVNHFWWTPPQGTRKVFMVDFQCFKAYWNQVYGKTSTTFGTKTNPKTPKFGRTTYHSKTNKPKNVKSRIVHKMHTYGRNKGTKTTFRRAA